MQRVFYTQAAILAVIAVLYFYFGLEKQYFWTVYWWDILLHILGGLWVSLAGAWLFSLFGVRLAPSHLVLLAFAVGVAWEIFEYILGIGGSVFMSYPVDTVKDILDDVLGGILGAFLITRL